MVKRHFFRRLYSTFKKATKTLEGEIPPIPNSALRKQFLCAAIPMVGFGFIDNTIMIRAGDAIDNKFGTFLNKHFFTSQKVKILHHLSQKKVVGGIIFFQLLVLLL
jgi:hypothetical protein